MKKRRKKKRRKRKRRRRRRRRKKKNKKKRKRKRKRRRRRNGVLSCSRLCALNAVEAARCWHFCKEGKEIQLLSPHMHRSALVLNPDGTVRNTVDASNGHTTSMSWWCEMH